MNGFCLYCYSYCCLFFILQVNARLRHLSLSYCGIDEHGCVSISKALGQLHTTTPCACIRLTANIHNEFILHILVSYNLYFMEGDWWHSRRNVCHPQRQWFDSQILGNTTNAHSHTTRYCNNASVDVRIYIIH